MRFFRELRLGVNKPINHSVFLTGFMGAGKTTLGALLAKSLEVPFIDLDAQIEAGIKKSIPEIFNSLGEPEFRKLESIYLRKICDQKPQVVALGGGTLICKANREQIRPFGMLIYLACNLEILKDRIKSSDRPLAKNLQQPQALAELFSARKPGYLSADATVLSDDRPVETVIQELLEVLAKWAN